MNQILVLGGTGFIGHHLVRELIGRGLGVRVLARPGGDRSLLAGMDAEIIDGDLDDPSSLAAALNGCDGLVHAAGHYPTYSIHPEREAERGRAQALRILDALANHPVERFLYVSTLSAVGRYPDNRPEDEAAPWPESRRASAYARVKREMQDVFLSRASEHNTLAVAPTAVFGPGDRKPTTGRIIVDVARGRMPVTLHGRTNAVSVFAVAEGAIDAFERGTAGRVYVLGGENLTIPRLCERIAGIADVRPPYFAVPAEIVRPLAWLGEQIAFRAGDAAPPLPLVGVDFANFGEYLSSDLARRELAYDPARHPLDDAIRDALAWFREHGYVPPRS
ncbi:MAG: Aurachin B dehydrogenase [Calditrichaeota bacterium]|nr:Aurachin B dehydrogenase [Calditrichota bacterium]